MNHKSASSGEASSMTAHHEVADAQEITASLHRLTSLQRGSSYESSVMAVYAECPRGQLYDDIDRIASSLSSSKARIEALAYFKKVVTDHVKTVWPADQTASGAESEYGVIGWMICERQAREAAESRLSEMETALKEIEALPSFRMDEASMIARSALRSKGETGDAS